MSVARVRLKVTLLRPPVAAGWPAHAFPVARAGLNTPGAVAPAMCWCRPKWLLIGVGGGTQRPGVRGSIGVRPDSSSPSRA